MPCGGVNGFGEPVNVLMLASEDDADTVIKPRLRKVGADLSRVFDLPEDERPMLPRDAKRLSDYVGDNRIRAIFIDPITDFVEGIDFSKNDQVRSALKPLKQIAKKHDALVTMSMHINKAEGKKKINQVTDSKAFVNYPRAVWTVDHDPATQDGHVVMVALKVNLTPAGVSYGYRAEEVPKGEQSRVIWDDGPGCVTIQQLEDQGFTLNPIERDEPRFKALMFLAKDLHNGKPRDSREIKALATTEDISIRTLERVASSLGVVVAYSHTVPAYTTWCWPLPEDRDKEVACA